MRRSCDRSTRIALPLVVGTLFTGGSCSIEGNYAPQKVASLGGRRGVWLPGRAPSLSALPRLGLPLVVIALKAQKSGFNAGNDYLFSPNRLLEV